jgi:heme-degrading monooxygenase HmoA
MTAIRVAIYPLTGSAEELVKRAQETLVPIYRDHAGFESLSVVEDADKIISITHWNSAEHAQEGGAAALEWVAKQSDLLGPPIDRHIGEEIMSA